jgi:hypothetical protein
MEATGVEEWVNIGPEISMGLPKGTPAGIPIGLTGLDGGHRIIPGQLWKTKSGVLLKVLEVRRDQVYWEVGENPEAPELTGCKSVEPLETFRTDKTLLNGRLQ